MIRNANPLSFPNLVCIDDEVVFKRDNTSRHLFKLDWSKFDEDVLKRFNRLAKVNANFRGEEFVSELVEALPKKYEDIIQSLEFAIPYHYEREIRRQAKLGRAEWGMERGFDTYISGMCLKPGEECIAVSFKLIADCIYDKKTKYFSRHENKFLIGPMLIYRFWMNQTGRGLPIDFSGLEELHDKYNRVDHGFADFQEADRKTYGGLVNELYDALMIQEALRDKDIEDTEDTEGK